MQEYREADEPEKEEEEPPGPPEEEKEPEKVEEENELIKLEEEEEPKPEEETEAPPLIPTEGDLLVSPEFSSSVSLTRISHGYERSYNYCTQGLNEINPKAVELEESNALALAIVPPGLSLIQL